MNKTNLPAAGERELKTQSRRHLQRVVRAAWDILVGRCSRKGCRNRAYVFGVCQKHVAADFKRAGQRIDREEHLKLVNAMSAALRSFESERESSPNVLISDRE